MYFDSINAIGNWISHWDIKVITRVVFIFQAALKIHVIANCKPINQKESEIVFKNIAHQLIIASSFGIKNLIRYGAVKNVIIQRINRVEKEIIELTFAISSALCRFFAHIFWPTSTEVDIMNHIAGIITSWMIFDQAQYEATAWVQKLAIKKVITSIQKLRADISIDEGNHTAKAFFIYEKSGLKSINFKWIWYLPFSKTISQIIVAKAWVKRVAIAAHDTHIGFINQYQ